MRRSLGFITLTPLIYGAIAAGTLILALGTALYVQTQRVESRNAQIARFVGEGKAAEQRAKERIALDKRNKERTDAETNALRRSNNALADSLRDARAGRGYLPAPGLSASRPDLACFDRAELDGALQRFVEGAAGLVGQGDEARIDLDAARRWAADR